ncbi:7976_t:CDS:1, partial [Funneliformis caledonium]
IPENEYTDRNFPGGSKNIRQYLTTSNFARPLEKRKSGYFLGQFTILVWALLHFLLAS